MSSKGVEQHASKSLTFGFARSGGILRKSKGTKVGQSTQLGGEIHFFNPTPHIRNRLQKLNTQSLLLRLDNELQVTKVNAPWIPEVRDVGDNGCMAN